MTKRKFLTAFLFILLAACLLFGTLLASDFVFFANAEPAENNSMKLEPLTDKSPELNNGYLDRYGVPTSKFTFTNNGDAEDGAPLSYAFDRNFNSVWRSRMQTTSDKNTVNTVTVMFETPTLIDRIVYQADSSWYDRGYFNTLTLSYRDEKGVLVNCEALSSRQTDAIVLVTLKTAATMKEVTLEWTKVPTNHRTVAAASEIIFLQPQSDDVERVQSMFTDYAQLKLDRGKVASKEDVERLRSKVKQYASYDTELNYLLNRAEQVLEGTVSYDARREMTTAPHAANAILQHGDVAGYARSSLKFAWFGTNRQATGVSASPGDELIVYVTGDESDPLPSVVCSQHWGSWRSWKSGEYKLRLGKNVIKVQNYLQEGYTDNKGDVLAAGGPVYLVNPYTDKDQSQNVKVYFEGGDLFPIFRENADESSYKRILADYAAQVRRDREENASSKQYKVVDVTEIVSDRVILTVQASMANELYNGQSYSPQKATEVWDNYVDGILQFDGIVLEDNADKLKEVGAKYDERNKWVNVNIRLAQPYGAAYAYTEHIGIQVSWEAGAISGNGSFGWGYTHEIGHMLDIGERTVSECSNNMVSKYHETVIERTAQRGDFAKTTEALAPDDHIASYWNTNRGNFIFWWLIESYWNGFWARLDNLYRYEDVFKGFSDEEKKSLGSMSATEKQVYLSSLVVQEDLSYYFERWGYNLGTNDYIFEADGENTSKAFKAVMQKAKEEGRIRTGERPKLWYLDAAEWWARYPDAEKSELYNGTETPAIKSVTKSGDGYNLILEIQGAERDAHLGFEIQEGSSGKWKVIGFTYDKMFLDPTDYRGTTPKYRVVAYDRALHTSKNSDVKSPATSLESICEIDGVKFGSLYEAVAAAKDGDTILLLKDTFETGILIDKTVTVAARGSCIVTKGGPQPIFTVVSRTEEDGTVTAGSLTLKGETGAPLLFDGGNISTNNPLILMQGGTFTAENCTFANNLLKSGNGALGGGLRIDGGAVSAKNCTFRNNVARLGGGVYINAKDVEFSDCTFSENTATEGGGVYLRHTAIFRNCTFTKNKADLGGGFGNFLGGVGELHSCTFTENTALRGGAVYADGKVTVYGGSMRGNRAAENGAAICYARSSTGARPFYVYGDETTHAPLSVTENVCEEGSAVYLYGETGDFTADVFDNATQYAVWFGGQSASMSGGRVGGTLFKEAGTPVFVKGSLPEAYVSPISVVTDSEETSLVLFTADFDLSEGDVGHFVTNRGKVVLNGKREVRLELEAFTVTLEVDGEQTSRNCLPGYRFVLEALGGDYQKTRYVMSWTDGEGRKYSVGEEIEVNGDMLLKATLADKPRVEFSIGNDDAGTENLVYHVMPSEPFSLPKIDPEKYVFNGWEYGGSLYQAYETAETDSDRVYTAKLTKKLLVNYAVPKDGEDVVYATRYYPYGSKIQFVSCHDESLVPSGGYINGFFAKNADGTYAPDFVDFDTYTAQSDDIWLLADVVDMPVYVMYSFTEDGAGFVDGTDTVLDLAPFGSVYTISLRTLPTGYHIVSLILQAGQQDTLYFDRADLDGFELELTEPFYIINADLTKNTYNVTYEINGEFYENRVMRHGDLLKFEDPTETLLKGAFPEGTEFSFTSYSLVTKDPLMGIDDLNATTEMNVQLGEEIAVTENITVNMIVYVKGQERAPEEETDPDDEAAQRLAIAKAEKRAEAQTAADALLQQVNGDPAFSEIKRSEFVTEIELALSAAFSEIDASTTVKETEEAIGRLTSAFERIREMMLREKNITVEVIVSGITAKGKTYDGTDKVELDLSHVVYLNAETLSEIDPAFSKDFVLDVKATLSDKNAGIRAVKLSVSLDGGTYYALAESGKEMTVMVEIGRAKLTVSVNEAGDPVYSGFAEGEDESVLSGELKIEYAEENGKRVMVPSGVSSDNYDITFVSCPAESSNLGLILGIVIPITVLAVAAVVIVFLVRKKRKS